MSSEDKLLLIAKVIVADMDDIARDNGNPAVFFGMGSALNRVFCIMRDIPFEHIKKIVPKDMMQWVRDQHLEGAPDSGISNSEKLIKLVN